jgi:hypothetical protein
MSTGSTLAGVATVPRKSDSVHGAGQSCQNPKLSFGMRPFIDLATQIRGMMTFPPNLILTNGGENFKIKNDNFNLHP